MLTYVVAFFLAALISAITTPIVARIAFRYDLLDRPTSARKVHTRPIPRIGGIAVFLAFFAPILGLAIYINPISELIYADQKLVAALCVGAAVILTLGIYDDVKSASVKLRLGVQVLVAAGMWLAGFRIELLEQPLGGMLHLGVLSLPLTVLWIVGIVNALNLIDGLDGLAAGVALFAASVLLGVSIYEGAVLTCVLSAALAGSLVGFLFFNFNPAKIFLGDSGSMFLGFILSTMSMWTQRKGATAVALLTPVVALGLPILDTSLAMFRRILKRQSPFVADREHVHHRLLALGLSHRGAVYTMYTASAVFALGALALLDADTTRRAIALSMLAALVLLLVLKVGIVKAPWMVRRPDDTASLPIREEARTAARQIRAARDFEAAWQELAFVLPDLGCDEVRLAWRASTDRSEDAAGLERVYHWSARAGDAAAAWKLDRPLPASEPAIRLQLAEGGRVFGELAVLRDRHALRGAHAAVHELALELLRDALVDFALERFEAAASLRVLRLTPIDTEVAGPSKAGRV